MENVHHDTALASLLKKSTQNTPESLSQDELSYLISCFVPTTTANLRSQAYLLLSAICERLRSANSQNEQDAGTLAIASKFLPHIEDRLADVEEQPLLEALSFVAALFGVDSQTASSIFQRDGFQDSMMDALELFPLSVLLQRVVANLLAQACGQKACRVTLSPRCTSWLKTTLEHTNDSDVRGATALAQVKFAQGTEADTSATPGSDITNPFKKQDELMEIMIKIIMDSSNSLLSSADAIEGLAYLSSIPTIKERTVKDSALLKKLVSFRPVSIKARTQEETPGTILYGLSVIMSNLCAYRPRLTDEEAHIDKLRRMTQMDTKNPGKEKEGNGGELDDDMWVMQRGKQLVKAGAVDVLVAIVRATESRATRTAVSKALLSLVDDKENRGKVLQAGGAKALMTIIRASLQATSSGSSSSVGRRDIDRLDLLPIQALAKLAITASPLQVFGPNEGATFDAIKPFSILLLQQSSTLLQRFEALMALTNLSSAGVESANRIAKTDGLVNKAEFLLLDENIMVRRAATELICNLVAGSEETFCRFSGEENGRDSERGGLAKSRIQVLVALSDVEDDATRMAASGALATLTSSPAACLSLLSLELERHSVLPVLKELIDPLPSDGDEEKERPQNTHPGLVHRGIVCIRNVLVNLPNDTSRRKLIGELEKTKIVPALVKVIKSGAGNTGDGILRPAAEALKCLVDSGMNVIAS